jgi:hypothetical protein
VHATHLFAGVAVSDFAVAHDWYERLFDAPPDSVPKEGEAVWHPVPSASIYITADPERAGNGLLTVAVKSLDDQRATLARHGLAFDDGAEPNGLPRLIVTDHDGNSIKFFRDPR